LEEYQKSPLYKASIDGYNVIITPHLGGASFDAMHQCEEFMAQKLIGIITTAHEN
jgi:phosphoglycerate dehydrogenase-like enzyme